MLPRRTGDVDVGTEPMNRMLMLLAIVLLAIAGCTSAADESTAPDNPETPAAVPAEPSDEAVVAAPSVAPTPGTAGSEPVNETLNSALASSTGADNDVPLTLNAVERRGDTVNVTFSVTNDGSEGNWQVAQFFDGPRREDVDEAFTLAGISVIDSQNGRRYPTVFDTSGACLCDSKLAVRFVSAGETARFSTVTGAPPEDVTEVDVQIPGFGTFSGIPLTP